MSCYFCGQTADGAQEHVPPEVLFRQPAGDVESRFTCGLKTAFANGLDSPNDFPRRAPLSASRSSPGEIITVPSCKVHNEDASDCDDRFAALIVQSSRCNWAGVELMTTWGLPRIARAVHASSKEMADVHDRFGVRVVRSPRVHEPRTPFAGHGDLESAARFFSQVIHRIAAGLHYAVSGGSVGNTIARSSVIETNAFRGWPNISDEETLLEFAVRHDPTFHWHNAPQRTIFSGSSQVFFAYHLWNKTFANRLALDLRFFQGVRFCVVVSPRLSHGIARRGA